MTTTVRISIAGTEPVNHKFKTSYDAWKWCVGRDCPDKFLVAVASEKKEFLLKPRPLVHLWTWYTKD